MRNLHFIVIFIVFTACSDDQEKGLLHNAPYASLTDSIQQSPSNAALYYRRGVLLYQNDEKQLAENDLRTAWNLQPTEEHGLSLTTILKQKHVDTAIVFLEEATRKLPNSIALKVGLARGYQSKGAHDKALAITDTIIAEHPGQLDALSMKAELLNKQQKTDESLIVLEQAYNLVPSDPQLAYDLAFGYAERGNNKIIRLTDSMIKAQTPEIEKAYYTRAVYFTNIKDHEQALKNYDNSIRANYNFLDAYRDKAELQFNLGKYNDALKTLQLGLKVNPAVAEFYYWTGRIMEVKGNKEDAKLNYQKAAGLDKSFSEAQDALNRMGK